MKKQIQLGRTDLKVYPVGLGCMGFSHASGAPTDHATAVKTIREAYEMGYDFFDTAECYHPGKDSTGRRETHQRGAC